MKLNENLKFFLIKLTAITIAIILIINITYNLILADKLEIINQLISLNKKENIEIIKNKIRKEIKNSLKKEKIIKEEDKELINDLINKIKNELKN